MGDITIQKLKAITGQFDPDMIYKVSLANAGLSLFFPSAMHIYLQYKIFFIGLKTIPESLKQCPNLTALDLSFNNLTSVEGLSSLKYLKTLILVSNKIEKLGNTQFYYFQIKGNYYQFGEFVENY